MAVQNAVPTGGLAGVVNNFDSMKSMIVIPSRF